MGSKTRFSICVIFLLFSLSYIDLVVCDNKGGGNNCGNNKGNGDADNCKTKSATVIPSVSASSLPSITPSTTSSVDPSNSPSTDPTKPPSFTPSKTALASSSRTRSVTPSETPTVTPSKTPSVTPTRTSSATASSTPSESPSETPSTDPSGTASVDPSRTTSVTPTRTPSATPTRTPSVTPTRTPSTTPSTTPSATPSSSVVVPACVPTDVTSCAYEYYGYTYPGTELLDCDGNSTNGCEVDGNSDNESCGACGHVCSLPKPNMLSICFHGRCTYVCKPGFFDCDGLYSNGCESSVILPHCASQVNPFCGGVTIDCNADSTDGCEVDPSSDPDNCGGCGVGCSDNHGDSTCVDGVCTLQKCDTDYADCDCLEKTGCETHLLTDSGSCGACGNACLGVYPNMMSECVDAVCQPPVCEEGFFDYNEDITDGCEYHSTPECVSNSDCASSDQCMQGVCNSDGVCEYVILDGFSCFDGSECTENDVCQPDGSCSGTPVVCEGDYDVCHNPPTCDPFLGCLPPTPIDCDDGNPCNGAEMCDVEYYGGCFSTGVGAPVCDDSNACNGVETCDPVSGGCIPGTPLVCEEDGVTCNGVISCDSELGCVTGFPVVCDDGNFCNGLETCDPVSDSCLPGTPVVCDDGKFCNGVETCDPVSGGCVPGSTPNCDDDIICNGLETCDPVSDSCVPGTPLVCDDGNACNGIEVCDGAYGGCYTLPGSVPTCDDENDCTTDYCDATLGCVHVPKVEVCNGIDDNCDGQIDEDLGSITCGVGSCQRTVSSCVNGVPGVCVPGTPSPNEECNGIDDNCNGLVDELIPPVSCVGPCGTTLSQCTNGVMPACTYVQPVTQTCGVGSCQRTMTVCPGSCIPGNPTTETCNGADDNCNGIIDDGFNKGQSCIAGAATVGGSCQTGFTVCKADGSGVTCNRPGPWCNSSTNGLPSCISGNCGITCFSSFGDCNNILSDGCEINIRTDNNHCGNCNTVCSPGSNCINGLCCGDGVKSPNEQCDDGNTSNGDGCSSTCVVEFGWNCIGSPSVCTHL